METLGSHLGFWRPAPSPAHTAARLPRPLLIALDRLVRALELLEEEIRTCLGLFGVVSLAELTPAHFAAAPPVFEPAALSAFPLLGEHLGLEPPA